MEIVKSLNESDKILAAKVTFVYERFQCSINCVKENLFPTNGGAQELLVIDKIVLLFTCALTPSIFRMDISLKL
jgi:hypothetical protein